MSQNRLNNVTVSHCHWDLLESIDINALMTEFIGGSDVRINMFGRL